MSQAENPRPVGATETPEACRWRSKDTFCVWFIPKGASRINRQNTRRGKINCRRSYANLNRIVEILEKKAENREKRKGKQKGAGPSRQSRKGAFIFAKQLRQNGPVAE